MKKATIAIILLAMLTGCSKTLTRGKAKDLIWSYNHYDKPIHLEIGVTEDEVAEIIKRGIWEKNDLTSFGRKFFILGNHCLVTVEKVHPEIEVTGIRGDESRAEVDFTTQWFAEVPGEVRDAFKDHKPEQHGFIMQRYDDGWRVDDSMWVTSVPQECAR